MNTHRPRVITSLSLLAAAGIALAGFSPLVPKPARAAGNKQQVLFGPVFVPSGYTVDFEFTNAGTQPTPFFAVDWVDVGNRQIRHSFAQTPLPSKFGTTEPFITTFPESFFVRVTFAAPRLSDAVPEG